MVQITSSILLVALLAAPSFAAPISGDYEDLSAREPQRLRAAVSRVGKLFTSNRVAAAAGVASAAGVIAGTVKASQASEQPTARDLELLEELATREPIFGKILRTVKKVGGTALNVAGSLTQRELDQLNELAEREPIFGKILFKAARKVAGVAAGALSGRDLEEIELDARAPIFGKIFRGVKKVAGTALNVAGSLTQRELDQLNELAEREPIFGKILFKAARKVAGVAAGALSGRELEESELSAREYDTLEDLIARDFEFDELD